MVDIKIVASGSCAECGHSQKDHEGNTICDVELSLIHISEPTRPY